MDKKKEILCVAVASIGALLLISTQVGELSAMFDEIKAPLERFIPKAQVKSLPMPVAASGEMVVKLERTGVMRDGSNRITFGWFNEPHFDNRREKLSKGVLKVGAEEAEIYIPQNGPYPLTTDDKEYGNSSMRVSVDFDKNGELPQHETWFSSHPVRIGDQMFKVKSVDPGGTWMVFSKSNVPLSGLVIGRKCPDFELWTTQGMKVTLADYKGKFLLLDVWSMT